LSAGGHIAHGMATQLRAAGEKVAALVMVASYPPPLRKRQRGTGDMAEPDVHDTTGEITRIIGNLREQAASFVGTLSDQEARNMAHVFRNTRNLVLNRDYGE